MPITLPNDYIRPEDFWIRFLWSMIHIEECWLSSSHFWGKTIEWKVVSDFHIWYFARSIKDYKSIIWIIELLYKEGLIKESSNIRWFYMKLLPPDIIQKVVPIDKKTPHESYRSIRRTLEEWHKKIFYSSSFLAKINPEDCRVILNEYVIKWELDNLNLSYQKYYWSKKQTEILKKFLWKKFEFFWENPVSFTIDDVFKSYSELSKESLDIFSTLLYFEKNHWIKFYTPNLYAVREVIREWRFSLRIKKELFSDSIWDRELETNSVANRNDRITYDESKQELIINNSKKKLLQKQAIFIEWLFDLQEKYKDWWVELEELAIYADRTFEWRSLKFQQKTLKNLYNIGNHLNKSIQLQLGIENFLELTTKSVRVSKNRLS